MTTASVASTMRIGELAQRTGVSARSLRYYEQQGLVHSTRSVGGHRLYRMTEVTRVGLIRQLFGAGLGSKVIARLLPCVDSDEADVAEAAFTTMVGERARLTAEITRLAEARDALDGVIEANTRHRLGVRPGDHDPA